LICRANGTVHLEKECRHEWTSNYGLIHLYYTLTFSKKNSELSIKYNTRVWNQQCAECRCFGDKSVKLAKLDKIARFFGRRLLEKADVIPAPVYDAIDEDERQR
jgi:hypothetical protein